MSARREQRWGAKRLSDTSGFTLLECLVAFAVMAMLLAVSYRGVVGLRQGALAFDDHTDRALVARAVLDAALADRSMKPGTYHGLREGHRWTIVARNVDLDGELPKPPEPRAGETKPPPAWATQRLLVRLDGPGRPYAIETLRLVHPSGFGGTF